MTERRAISKDSVVALLASALGKEKSDEVVLAAAHGLGVEGTTWTGSEVRAILEQVTRAEGLVGVVARFVTTRGDVERLVQRSKTSEPPSGPPSRRTSAAPRSGSVGVVGGVDIIALLAPALGAEKARDATENASSKLGFDARTLSHEEALCVLDDLSASEGIVGVVARFAKARFVFSA